MESQDPPKSDKSLTSKLLEFIRDFGQHLLSRSSEADSANFIVQPPRQEGLLELPQIASKLLSHNPWQQRSARVGVAQILKNLPVYDPWWFSCNSLGEISQGWYLLKADYVEAVAGSPEEDAYPWVLGLLSRHTSGYVRHKAVKLLSNLSDGHELPFLLVRQNDWVEAVAKEARLAVDQRINERYASHLARQLPLIEHLLVYSRHDHSPLVQQVFTLLVDEKYTSLLDEVFATAPRHLQRFLMQQCISIPGKHQAKFLEVCLKSSDPMICSWGCSQACRVYSEEKLYSYLESLTTHHFVVVRKVAMQEIARLFPARDPALWRQSLLDVNQCIRELARYWAMQQGMTAQDIHEVYRAHLNSSIPSLAALQGLQEVGREEDASIFRQYLTHSYPAYRQTAIRGFCKFPTEAILEAVVGMLWDPSPPVVQEVGNALLPMASSIDAYYLCGVAVSGPHKRGRSRAVKLLAAQGKWKSIPFLLRVAAEGSAEVASQAEEAIDKWLGFRRIQTSFMPPQVQDRRAIMNAVEEFRTRVTPAVVAMVVKAIE